MNIRSFTGNFLFSFARLVSNTILKLGLIIIFWDLDICMQIYRFAYDLHTKTQNKPKTTKTCFMEIPSKMALYHRKYIINQNKPITLNYALGAGGRQFESGHPDKSKSFLRSRKDFFVFERERALLFRV